MTTIDELGAALARVPDPEPRTPAEVDAAIAQSVHYLASDAALRSLDVDPYWPKWNSPWWHMLLLFELGEARRIPERAVERLVAALDALPLHIFPIRPEDTPPGLDPDRHSSCHCALGCIAQVLAACGVDVDRALPWVKPWFVRYQMADGGLNCDAGAYLVTNECPSSMVGTVAPFEAMLLGATASPEQTAFLERAAGFLVERRLMHGSQTVYNAEERTREPAWLAPCFPRFYFYDVLRGASALVRWAQQTGRTLPLDAIAGVVSHLVAQFPDGVVTVQRRAVAGVGTRWRTDGTWVRRPQATSFPLLDATSVIGQPCPAATRQWTATRRTLRELIDRRLVVA